MRPYCKNLCHKVFPEGEPAISRPFFSRMVEKVPQQSGVCNEKQLYTKALSYWHKFSSIVTEPNP